VNVRAAPSAQQRASVPTILTVAWLEDAYKEFDLMMRGLPLVRARLPEVQWVLVSDGRLKPHQVRLAQAYGVERNLSFVGSVSDQERDRWLERAHGYAMPSSTSPAGARRRGLRHGIPRGGR